MAANDFLPTNLVVSVKNNKRPKIIKDPRLSDQEVLTRHDFSQKAASSPSGTFGSESGSPFASLLDPHFVTNKHW